jgi:predicted TIM-barrel fold metal-dependent hydrolase
MPTEKKPRIVDAHMHLYDSEQNRYEHMERKDAMLEALLGDYSALPKRYLFEDYVADMSDVTVDGIVWHEFIAVDSLRELQWAQRLAEGVPVPMAIVQLVDFLAPDLEKRLDAYTQYPNVAVVRQHLAWDATNPMRCMARRGDFLTDARWRQGVRLLRKYKFKCSLEVFSPQLPDLLGVIRENPETDFTIPVMGWPVTADDEEFARWRRSLQEIASCENVRLTISAVECVFGMDWEPMKARPWVEAAIELIGVDRVMFGSHRPISKLARRVARPYAAYGDMTKGLSETERDALFRGNAARWFWSALDRKKVLLPESA